jgi:hypothetical protein
MSVRVFALIAFIIAIIFFVVALIVNAATNPTSVQHYEDIGFIAVAAGLALWCIEPVINRTP